MNPSQTSPPAARPAPFISLPQPLWLILLALAIGLSQGLSAPALIKSFGSGFGRALGDFALILLPSFVLAACLGCVDLHFVGRVVARGLWMQGASCSPHSCAGKTSNAADAAPSPQPFGTVTERAHRGVASPCLAPARLRRRALRCIPLSGRRAQEM